jgi:hypothetical protein
MFEADQKAWTILAAHHTEREDLPMLCLRAVQYLGPAQERFLRGLLNRPDLSRERMGFATVALAELLAQKHDTIEMLERRRGKPQDELTDYFFAARVSRLREGFDSGERCEVQSGRHSIVSRGASALRGCSRDDLVAPFSGSQESRRESQKESARPGASHGRFGIAQCRG